MLEKDRTSNRIRIKQWSSCQITKIITNLRQRWYREDD